MKMVEDYSSVQEFVRDHLPFLEYKEAENNLVIGILMSMNMKALETPPLLISVKEYEKPVLCAIQTPPNNLIICALNSDLTETLLILIEYLIIHEILLPGVIGAKNIANQFAKMWCNKTGFSAQLTMNQMVYQLDQVRPIRISAGNIRQATLNDFETIQQMVFMFGKEVGMPMKESEARVLAKHKISDQSIWVWEDGHIVSMAASSRPTKHGISINYVYTPIEMRKKGYATSCVALLSKAMLDENYDFCTLFTDLSNPTSNEIYQKIGYFPICPYQQYKFLQLSET